MSIVSLQHVQMIVPAALADEARRFYGELLGLEEMRRPQSLSDAGRTGVWYRIGDQELHLRFETDPDGEPELSDRHPALVTNDLDGLRKRLSAAGCELDKAIPIEGRARFFARDPGGNRIEFLAFTVDRAGA
ncbi:MAG: VOC family protein [Chloroflexi bacterium]|nr:VOC family protein [Chloroflexota bacterium]MCI0782886.1 VOC family protein [Chloroflexota bacterium]MCI0813983.1 VOC family protein [Chloroflexota bacterium]MCI0819493.1 VOC family protein [Chloroflexota bacterium]MCI0831850.1 VOC family protein [Chloroflexota bacterium]